MNATPNLAASVMARLLTRAKLRGDDYQLLVTAYAFERLLYRLGQSSVRDRFVLKGAMLLRLWSAQPYRATRDLDLLRRGEATFDAIRVDLEAILATPVPDDGITFDAAGLVLQPMQADDEYTGTRAILPARCGSARLSLQVDLGVGDAVWPEPVLRPYPALLDAPAPEVLGDRNSRIKDFFDLQFLAVSFPFDRRELGESVRRTFERRGTPVPHAAPIGLTPVYWENPSRPTQVRAFSRRAGLAALPENGSEFNAVLSAFLLPILADVAAGRARSGTWAPGGPWA